MRLLSRRRLAYSGAVTMPLAFNPSRRTHLVTVVAGSYPSSCLRSISACSQSSRMNHNGCNLSM
jgi:hypothetical protein